MTIYAEINHPIDSRKLYDAIGINVTDVGARTFVYGEPSDLLFVIFKLLEYDADFIQIRG